MSDPLVEFAVNLVENVLGELVAHLHLMDNCDLGALADTGISRLIIRDRRLSQGLDRLPARLPLTALTLDNLAEDRNLRQVGRWPGLEYLAFTGMPDEQEIGALRDLPALRRVLVDRISEVSLGALQAALPGVEVVSGRG